MKYIGIIAGLPEFEKGDRFQMNIVNCAMPASGGTYCDCGYKKKARIG